MTVEKLSERNMEIVEDDLFFADLSKRISLLIMDDDEDPTLHCPPVSFQVCISISLSNKYWMEERASVKGAIHKLPELVRLFRVPKKEDTKWNEEERVSRV